MSTHLAAAPFALEIVASFLQWRDRAPMRLIGKRMHRACISCIMEEYVRCTAEQLPNGIVYVRDHLGPFFHLLCEDIVTRFANAEVFTAPPLVAQELAHHFSHVVPCRQGPFLMTVPQENFVAVRLVAVLSTDGECPVAARSQLTSLVGEALRESLPVPPNTVSELDLSHSASYPLRSINASLFAACSNLVTVRLEGLASLRIIEPRCFEGCAQLRYLTVRGCSDLTTIGHSAFAQCVMLTNIVLSELGRLEVLDEGCFRQCSRLCSVDLRNCSSLRVVGQSCFEDCGRLSSFKVDGCSSLNEVGTRAFKGCIVRVWRKKRKR